MKEVANGILKYVYDLVVVREKRWQGLGRIDVQWDRRKEGVLEILGSFFFLNKKLLKVTDNV